MHSLIRVLIANGPVVTDGAWGTQLQNRGLPIGAFPDAWNLLQPDHVYAVARAYVEAGSQVILTNTFGSNRVRLSEAGLADQLIPLNQQGVALSRRAAESIPVFASIGPTGKMLLAGDISTDELRAVYEEQAVALAEAKPDAIVIETMSDLEEARIAVEAAHATGLPVVACMVFDSGKDKDRTMMGTTPEQAAETLVKAGADVLGANCGQGIAAFTSICQRLRSASGRPIWIKPNAGLPEVVDNRTVYHATPTAFARHAPALVEAGAAFLGGCCGTTPDFIRELASTLPRKHSETHL